MVFGGVAESQNLQNNRHKLIRTEQQTQADQCRCYAVCLGAQSAPQPAFVPWTDEPIGHPVLLPLLPGAARGGPEAHEAVVKARPTHGT